MGESNKGGWWKLNHGALLCYSLFILLHLASKSSALEVIKDFNFTRDTYNATIYEKAPGKTYVMSSQKMGIYLSNTWLTVNYKIFDGDKLNVFKAEEYRVGDFYFLRVRTLTSSHGILNRELENRYHLKIRAVGKIDPGISKTATCDLIINVLDKNDLHPLFDKEKYNVTVREDAPLHSNIVTVSASDGDVGINSEIYYSFLKKNDYFAIHPTTGAISITKQLNFIEQEKYELEVQAQDRGPKTLQNGDLRKTMVYINVTPANFYPPSIAVKQLPFAHMKDIVGTTFAILTITDADVYINGLIQKVEILSGDPKNFFKIVKSAISDEYLLILSKSVIEDGNSDFEFSLTVKATDSGLPSKYTLKELKIKIQDALNRVPKFKSNIFYSSIEESVPIDTSVIHVSASREIIDRNFDIYYEIVAGNEKNWFSINRNTGLIKTRDVLDAETVSEVHLTIMAKVKNGIETSSTNVTIKLIDCNDNPPKFDIKETDISFDENLPVGSSVFKIVAVDPDEGENGVVSYSISNLKSIPFEIDHFTGEIKNTKVLDYETMKRNYQVYVVASDWGKPFKLESYITLNIHLRNVNDNKPLFEKMACSGYLSREAPIGTSIVVITAVDFDNNIITYSIEDGNNDGCFEVEETTGLVSSNCSLRDFPTDQRSLIMTASDGTFKSDSIRIDLTLVNNKRNSQLSNADANVKCATTNASAELVKLMQMSRLTNEGVSEQIQQIPKQINAHPPIFNTSFAKNIEVLESSPVGSYVYRVMAHDDDKGYYGMVIYVITAGDPYDHFKLDLHNGSLYVNAPLDRETTSSYSLEIMASDSAPIEMRKTATLTISVDVKDVNDNPPVFEKEKYEAEVSESIGFNATILQVFAEDKDEGVNSKISYSILADMPEFSINQENGILSVKKPLDRELHDVYHIPVLASDSGSPPLSSTATVTLTVLDENDNIPKFIPEGYDLKVREDLPVGSVITTIKAVDPDYGQNGKLTYKLSFGSDGMFEIEETTGTMRIAKQLNFQTKQVYNISAFVSDNGNPPLKSACFINIEVMDVNENLEPPVFKNFFEIGYINENMPIGSVVFQVSATDPDASPDDRNPVIYSIRDGSGLGRFKIDNNGTITTTQVLDRESAAHYWLSVYAQDRGLVPQHARLDVYIKVIDVNDNIPQMSRPVYYMEVKENSKADMVVGLVEATDKDDNPSDHLSFSISMGNTGKHFHIDADTGVIRTTRWTLDRDEGESQHLLEITVNDNGTPSLSSTARVLVKVLDENDNAPDFREHNHRVRILKPKPGSKKNPVLRVFAIDKDEGNNGQLSYKIQGKKLSKFYVDRSSGQIYVDDVEAGAYSFRVRVYDRGENRLKDSCKVMVEVMERPKVSQNPPTFVQNTFRFDIEENAELGAFVGLIEATDLDNDKLWYYVIDGDSESQFAIGTEFGTILVAKELDWETKNHYNLTISVTDGIHITLTTVHINIIDINDNSPMFLSPSYQTNIPENTDVGMSILKVSATDKDENSRLFYTISAAENTVSINKFNIDSRTGVITVKEELDREVLSTHILTIMVRDQGIPSNRNFTRVIIHVSDHNDHAPQFLSSLTEGRVFETAAIGTSVLEVIGFDNDKGENAEISYSIQSGNIGDMFSIDETLGLISVKRELDKNQRSEYNLIVMATDHGKPPLSSTATVRIYVTISNNAPPKFTGADYTAEINEDIKIGDNVAVLEAKCQSSVYYEIIQGNEDSKFAINPNSGVVYIRNEVDYEQVKTYSLKVAASNIVGHSAVTTVKIHVLDINDNAPVFGQTVYEGSITEAAPVGSVVIATNGKPLVIHATDKDENDNGRLQFKMNGDALKGYFTVDPSTGAVRTSGLLDHEAVTKVEFTVQVSDQGNPTLQAKQAAKVIILIEDVNDHAPEFTPKDINTVLLLPTARGVRVAKVTAIDPDTNSSEVLKYRILPETDGVSHFAIDPVSGLITIVEVDNLMSKYSLTVEASDGKFQTTTQVNISVDKSEDSGFVFSHTDLHMTIPENEPVTSKMVIQLVNFANDPFVFDLLNGNDMFMIGETSGVLQAKKQMFDREQCDHYDLVVSVEDLSDPPRVAHVIVKVNIEDKNDNSPVFLNQPYETVVAITSEVGTPVRQLTAMDPDDKENGEIEFILEQGYKNKFDVNKETGIVTLKEALGVEDVGLVILTVKATDHGTPSRDTFVNITVTIIGSEHPVFERQFYTASVKEDVPLFTTVTSVKASSPNGHKLIYSITGGDPYKEFSVDYSIGKDILGPCVVSVVSLLDYESTQGYELTLTAKDVTTGSIAETKLRITVIDVNDNKPIFSKFKYTSLLSETVPIGTSVAMVTATDADVGSNGLVYYSLVSAQVDSDDVNYFDINSETGLVSTIKIMDYEKQKEFNVIAIATDGGQYKHFTPVPLHIILQDLNDNPPYFEQQSYDCTIFDQLSSSYVTKVMASDPDSCSEGNLVYSIVAGNIDQVFHIHEQTGLISLSSRRVGSLLHAYILNVSVTDGVFTAFTQVSVSVKRSNDHTPMFPRSLYRATILENLGKGMLVTMVTAFDEDPGTNGMLTYSIPSSEMKQYFSIDADTGELFTECDFDREKRSFYQVPVSVTDNAGRMGFSMVEVTIRDVNDNPPQFLQSEYEFVVSSMAAVNTSFAKVVAVDKDQEGGGRVRYEMATPEQLFHIHPYTGELQVANQLVPFANQKYQFFVRAIDEGDPSLDTAVAVEIHIMSKNDVPPTFKGSKRIIYTISEEETSFSRLVAAESQSPVKYYLVNGNMPETNYPPSFEVSSSGKLKLIGKLDFDFVQKYSLTIQAKTISTPPLFDYVDVIIMVADVNNKDPVFESQKYYTTAIENGKPGDKVIQVRANDEDRTSEIRYSFGDGSEEMAKIFNLDPISGLISLINPLDRENIAQYNFTIIAKDTAASKEQTSKTQVFVEVADQNDNPPIFSRPSYKTSVHEDAAVGTVLLELTTTDADAGINTNVQYIIIDGDPLGKFLVRTTGELIVIKPLDREMNSKYDLTVVATDGGMSTMTKVTVTILDANDNAPVCEEPIHELVLSEDSAVGSIIARVKATDSDDASTINAEISYIIRDGNERQKFDLDKSTGILTVRSILDREDMDNYHLSIKAIDGGGKSCDIDVYINLSDVNDCSPQFINIPEAFPVTESTPANTLLMRVRAIDNDLGINRQVTYGLRGDTDGSFSLDPEIGVITLLKPLDREQQDVYKLMLEAHDKGNPSLTGEALLKIVVQDENDNPPMFVQSSYNVNISENVEVNASVTMVTATSLDIGKNAQMLYSITAGNVDGHFAIDEDTGMISVLSNLDHEVTPEYILTITAQDRSDQPLSSHTFVTILVTDVNDNRPEFVQDQYKLSLKEDTAVSQVILHLTASDADSESVVLYSITSGNKVDTFDVDPKDGKLRIKNPLDREMINNYELTIRASDGMLYSETSVIVDVLDVNDCPPKFAEANYSAVIQEDKHAGHSILQFSVTDDDLPPNGAPFTYDIVSGNEGREFMVNSKGVLTTAGKFNRNVQSFYHLVVRAYDFGSPLLHSDVPVDIEIIEEGNNPPKVSDFDISVMTFKDSFSGGIIGKLDAVDEDIFDELTYEIISSNKNLFDIDKYDGRIIALNNIDPGKYAVNVSVSDGRYEAYGVVNVEIVGISNEMIKNSMTIQFHSLSVEDFFNKHLKDFKRVLKRELDVKSRNIEIINVQSSVFSPSSFGKRKKREASMDLDVLFAIKDEQNSFIRGKILSKQVANAVPAIEQALDVKVIKVFNDICTHSSCKEGACEGYIEFDDKNLTPVKMGSKSTVTSRHQYLFKCVCPDGSTDCLSIYKQHSITKNDSCDIIPSVCPTDACPANKVCKIRPDGVGYMCVCPPGKSGQFCDEDEEYCTDSGCNRGDKPMTFSGKSYARWTLQDAFTIESRLSLSLRIKTRKQIATIMYAKGKVDYSILEIFNGMLQYRFDCGSGEGTVVIPLLISDGEWHTILVERRGKMAQLILDDIYSSMEESPGSNDVLDLLTNNVYFGAEVEIYNGFDDVRRGFEGCMENIRLHNVRLPFDGSNAVAVDHEFRYLQFHCKDSYQSPTGTSICSTFPCDNNGNCQVTDTSYMCTCPDRFYGKRCEIDSNPCANNPCKNNGQCVKKQDMLNDFECKCPHPYRGKFCQYGKFCTEEICRNNGTCVEGPKSMVCNCLAGFEGKSCEKVISACGSNPCKNGATCHNTEKTYICNCTGKSAGRNCEEIIVPNMVTGTAGITQEELYIIIGVASALVFLAFIFLAVQCYRRRHSNRYGNITLGIPTDETDVMLRSLKDDSCKNGIKKSNMDITHPPPSPRPPPVPDRPASYTPSNHDSLNTLNNFDNVRNYGSAADELENIQNIPYYAEYLQTFAPLPRMVASQAPSLAPLPSSNPASDTDSIQKSPWEIDNMLEHHEDKNHPEKLYIKNIPGPQVGPPDNVSFSSLPVSESEDEPAASKSGRRKKRKEYHWDASDWAPRPSLPNISEVPNKECPDSTSSSPHSNESNENAGYKRHNFSNDMGIYTDPEMLESEYVGDSEIDCDTDHYLNPPNYQEIFSQYLDNGDSEQQESYELPQHNFRSHPNEYLPTYNLNDESRDDYSDNENFPDPPEEFRGGENRVSQLSEDDLDDNDDVMHYGFPAQQPLLGYNGNITDSEYNVRSSIIDSMGGYTSTNASCSDISGLCEIEDSEVNLSEDSGDENNENTPLNLQRLHTQV